MRPAILTTRPASQPYPCASASKYRLKRRKKPRIGRSHQRSWRRAACGFNSSAHIAGDSVSDTISEMIVAPVMVRANWR